jgi:hypothetical protein
MSIHTFRLSTLSSSNDQNQNPTCDVPSAHIPVFRIDDYDSGPTFNASTPPPTKPRIGSFEHDQAGDYMLRWASLDDMRTWLRKEEKGKTIEFRRREVHCNDDIEPVWSEKHIYLCARQGSGGLKKYKKKYAWTRKVPVKRTSCGCRLTIKTYPGTQTVLGLYRPEHDHPIGDENARFTRLPEATRAEIERLLRLGVEPKVVVRIFDILSISYQLMDASISSLKFVVKPHTRSQISRTSRRSRLIEMNL